MKKVFLFLFIPFFINTVSAQTISENSFSNKVATVGGEIINLSELVETYSQSSSTSDMTVDELKSFLPSYVEYKMKLKEGYANNFDTDPEILEEFEEFGRQAAFNYWIENELKQQIIDKHLEKSKYELKAYHILAAVEPNAEPKDTLEAYNRMIEARNKIINGADLTEIDSEYSTKRNGRSMGGQLPWLKAGTTVPEFEETVFSLEEGEVSQPFRTQFGYHVIKLQEKRLSTPDRMVSHIFIQNRQDDSDREIIHEIHNKLESDTGWNELVAEYSEDNASINRNGNINWVGYGTQFAEDFVDAVMRVNPDKPFSEPVQSIYGYHILRIDSVRSYLNEEHRREELVNQLQQQQRLNPDRQEVVEALKKKGNLNYNSGHVNQLPVFFQNHSDTPIENITPARQISERVLFSFDRETFRYSDFLNWLSDNHTEKTGNDFKQMWFNDYVEDTIESKIIDFTRKAFPEYEAEIQRFLDGLIVFKVSNDHVWNPDTADLASLKNYYQNHKSKYKFNTGYAYILISSRSDSLLEITQAKITEGLNPADFEEMYEDISIHYDSTRNMNSSAYKSLKEAEPGTFTEIFSRGVYKSYYYLDKILEPRTMTFDEAYRRVVSDYQPIREEYFLNYLENKYDPKLFPENIQ